MQVVYKGEYVRQSRSYGCSKCGTGSSVGNGKEVYQTEYKIYFDKRFIKFKKDEPVDVDDLLGNFLLKKTHVDKNGDKQKTFEEYVG